MPFLMRQGGKLTLSPAQRSFPKTRKTAPFWAQPVSKLYGDQPLFGLFGAQCSPERSRLLGNSLFPRDLQRKSSFLQGMAIPRLALGLRIPWFPRPFP
jgi:hypothetical protein